MPFFSPEKIDNEITEMQRAVFSFILALMALIALFLPLVAWMRAFKDVGVSGGYHTLGQQYADALDITWPIGASALVVALFFLQISNRWRQDFIGGLSITIGSIILMIGFYYVFEFLIVFFLQVFSIIFMTILFPYLFFYICTFILKKCSLYTLISKPSHRRVMIGIFMYASFVHLFGRFVEHEWYFSTL